MSVFQFIRLREYGLCLLVAISLYNGQARAGEYDLDFPFYMNIDIIYMGFKLDGETGTRNDLVLQIPFALSRKSLDEKSGWHFGLYVAGHDYVNNKGIKSSNTGVARLYYLKHSTESLYTLLPSITFYRAQTIRYIDTTKETRVLRSDDWMLPGLIGGLGLSKLTFLHTDLEWHNYIKPENYRARFGISHKLKPNWSMSLVHELSAWDFSISSGMLYSQKGFNRSLSLRSIHHFKVDKNWPISNFTFSVGLETYANKGNQSILLPADIHRAGNFFMLNVSTGKMMW